MTETKTYTCEMCEETFDYEEGWDDQDARAEMEADFGPVAPSDAAVVCDDCYRKTQHKGK